MGTGWESRICRGKQHGSAWHAGERQDSWAIAIICRLEGCGLGQGQSQEMLVDRGQTMKSQHSMPKSLNFVLQTLGVVEMEVR